MTLSLCDYDTHIVFVSRQTMPNYLPALDPNLGPNNMVLVRTSEMRDTAKSLSEALLNASPNLQIEYCDLDGSYDLLELSEKLESLIQDLKSRGLKPLFNITGGTKTMTIAAMIATENTSVPAFYLPLNSDEVIFVRELETVRLNTSISLKNYLMLYGFRMEIKPDALPYRIELKNLTKQLIETTSFRDAYPTINFLAAKAKGTLSVDLDEAGTISQAGNALLDQFESAGLLSIKAKKMLFAGESARFFVNGGWLEDFTAAEAINAFPEAKIHKNVKIIHVEGHKTKSNLAGTTNELDVAFVYKGKLCLIECKTLVENDKNNLDNPLYKLDSLSKAIGITVCPILVSYLPVSDKVLQRASTMNIAVIAGNDLKRLGERLKSIVRHKEF